MRTFDSDNLSIRANRVQVPPAAFRNQAIALAAQVEYRLRQSSSCFPLVSLQDLTNSPCYHRCRNAPDRAPRILDESRAGLMTQQEEPKHEPGERNCE